MANIFTVTEITKNIKIILESNFYNVWIKGEVSNIKYHSSGHIYFSLVDKFSSIRAVIYRSRRENIKSEIKNGANIVVFGSIGVYEKGGYYQVTIEFVKEAGKGKKFEELETIKKELKKSGYFDRKRPIPGYPKNILILTSISGASVKDMIKIIKRRMFGVDIYIYPITVQGNNAKSSILTALNKTSNLNLNIDCLIMARGGGSMDDLWIFNDKDIAIALFNSKYPTISAIGHEIDYTLCDFVADKRAETPSSAIEMLLKNRIDLIHNTASLRSSIKSYTFLRFKRKKEQYDRISLTISPIRIKRIIENLYIHVDNLIDKMEFLNKENVLSYLQKYHALKTIILNNNPNNKLQLFAQKNLMITKAMIASMHNKLNKYKNKLDLLNEKLFSSNPINILRKGYSITFDSNNNIIKNTESLSLGDKIVTQLANGNISSIVNDIIKK